MEMGVQNFRKMEFTPPSLPPPTIRNLRVPTLMMYYSKITFYYYSKFMNTTPENVTQLNVIKNVNSIRNETKVKNIEEDIAGNNEEKYVV